MEDKFPKHEASLHLTHNQHKAYYESVEQAIESGTYRDDCWLSDAQKQKAIANDSVWELQWYPHTPIGSHSLLACDLDLLISAANE